MYQLLVDRDLQGGSDTELGALNIMLLATKATKMSLTHF